MIGERIKESREKNGMTQAALSKKLGISRSAVNAWEMGISVPSAQYLVELSQLFNISTDYLLELNEKEMIDISFLSEEEKRMIYSLLDYFKKYGESMRSLSRQIDECYDIIEKKSNGFDEKTLLEIKNILNEIMLTKGCD